ncbi:MAG: hypothetical protein DMG57_32070 [Acidobacteria bacterium]|nr:MAG: hypothetical protein DMG57_32070 [Acidobacteriota bacterium]
MRSPVIVTAIVLATHLVSGQDKPAEVKQEAPEAVIIPVKTLSGDSFRRLVELLAVFKASYRGDEKLRTIVVYAPKDVVGQMRRVVEELDRPGSEAAIGHNIDMTLAFLRCSTKPSSEKRELPADLEAAARQLRAATQYKDIQLWDIVPVHLQEGKDAENSLRLPVALTGMQGMYATAQVHVRAEAVIRKETGRYVRFDVMRINFRIPQASPSLKSGVSAQGINPLVNTQYTYIDVGLNTAGDFKEDQKTVLGKISGIDDESAIFVVISLKVLD